MDYIGTGLKVVGLALTAAEKAMQYQHRKEEAKTKKMYAMAGIITAAAGLLGAVIKVWPSSSGKSKK